MLTLKNRRKIHSHEDCTINTIKMIQNNKIYVYISKIQYNNIDYIL